jgi:hypothetical protein
MAGVTDKVLPHLESMPPDSILDRVNDIEKYDRLASRTYGLSENQGRPSSLNVGILMSRTLVAVKPPPNQTPAQDYP